MRSDLEAVISRLLAREESDLSLDAFADAIGVLAVTSDEIDAMMHALELRGVRITAPFGGGGVDRLRTVLAAARSLGLQGGQRPTAEALAAHTGLSLDDVRHALALGRVMGR